jgi:hypothetical protein
VICIDGKIFWRGNEEKVNPIGHCSFDQFRYLRLTSGVECELVMIVKLKVAPRHVLQDAFWLEDNLVRAQFTSFGRKEA